MIGPKIGLWTWRRTRPELGTYDAEVFVVVPPVDLLVLFSCCLGTTTIIDMHIASVEALSCHACLLSMARGGC